MQTLNRLWDYVGPSNAFIPNGLNYNYLKSYIDTDFNHTSIDSMVKLYEQTTVYDCHLNTAPSICKEYSVADYNSDEFAIYTITPFGNILCGLGEDFTFHQNKTFFDFVSKTAIKKINTWDNVFLVVDYSSEADIREQVYHSIHEGLEKNKIRPEKVIFISSCINAETIYESAIREIPPSAEIKIALNPWAVYGKSRELVNVLSGRSHEFKGNVSKYNELDKIDFDSPRKVKFNFLNRRLRPHRVVLLSLLANDNLLNDNHVSYDLDFLWCAHDTSFYEVYAQERSYSNRPFLEDRDYIAKSLKGYRKMSKTYKKVLDYDDFHSIWGFGFEQPWVYNESYFSIVGETLFYEAGVYMSEKTFKPIAHCHPFVILSKAGTLKYLKKLGFKTFDDIWDESYDEIEDDSARLIAVYKVIKELSDKSDDDWISIYQKIKDRLIFNRNHLMSFSLQDKKLGETFVTKIKQVAYENPKKNYLLLPEEN